MKNFKIEVRVLQRGTSEEVFNVTIHQDVPVSAVFSNKRFTEMFPGIAHTVCQWYPETSYFVFEVSPQETTLIAMEESAA
jgi:hypothetical protein